MREFCGNLRAFCGQNGYGFSAPHNFGMPLHVLTNLRASFSRLPLQTFVYSVKGREHWNSLFLGVLGVSGFCGKKCYDFPNIQSKAETTFFFQEDEGPGCAFSSGSCTTSFQKRSSLDLLGACVPTHVSSSKLLGELTSIQNLGPFWWF